MPRSMTHRVSGFVLIYPNASKHRADHRRERREDMTDECVNAKAINHADCDGKKGNGEQAKGPFEHDHEQETQANDRADGT